MRLKIYIDGGARGNPGPAAAGVVVRSADDGTVLFQAGYYLGQATNNVAEYQGLLMALGQAGKLKASAVQVFSDSELLVRQMNGQYRVRNEGLRPLFEQARQLVAGLERFEILHIPREQNVLADKLVNQALNVKKNVQDAAD